MKTKMKLSTAILEGSKLRPQKFGPPYPGDDKSCTMIAALEVATGSLGKAIRSYERESARKMFPAVDMPFSGRCPSRGCKTRDFSTLEGLIYHLNDLHEWKRERIAAFVAKQEAKA